MRKIVSWILLSVLIFSGCASQPSQDAGSALPDYTCSGTYYKLEIAPLVYDEDVIMDYLLPGIDRSNARRNERGQSSMSVDNNMHYWGSYAFGSEFSDFKYNKGVLDLSRAMTEQEALACSGDFIRHIGYQVAENPEFEEHDEGPDSVYYCLTYEGVPILGRCNYYMENGEFALGEYIEVMMDGSGIAGVAMRNLYDVTAVLEEYPAEALISKSRLEEVVDYSRYGDPKYRWIPRVKYDYQTNGVELIYIPVLEEEKWVLLPAFCVSYSKLRGEKVIDEARYMLIDAVSGYVYQR